MLFRNLPVFPIIIALKTGYQTRTNNFLPAKIHPLTEIVKKP